MFILEDYLKEKELILLDKKSDKKDYVFIESKYGVHEIRICSLRIGGVPTIQTAVDKRKYFENRAREIHGLKYNYDKVDYKTSKKAVIITCLEHGDFNQDPSVHMKGGGCPICARRRISTSRKNGICGWSLSDWINLAENSSEFSGYRVYIIKCFSENESFIKIGRTFKEVKNRFCSSNDMPYSYEIITEIQDNSFRVFKLENKLKKMCKQFSITPSKRFNGIHECFTLDALDILKQNNYVNT